MTRRWPAIALALTVVALTLSLSGSALANPPDDGSITYHGHIVLNGAAYAYTGAMHVQATLWDAPQDGNALETVEVGYVNAVDGEFFTTLPFSATIIETHDWLWVEVAVKLWDDSSYWQLYPRQAISSAAYAVRAASMPWSGLEGCSIGQLRKWDGSAWVCSADEGGVEGSTYFAGWGLVLSDTTFSVDPTVITGTVGPQGPQGEIGPQGPQGETGPQGPAGITGTVGATGATGPQGPQGETGPQGIQGETGAQGIQGLQGIQGIQGETGPQGIQGPQGNGANLVAGWGITSTGGTTPTVSATITNGTGLIWTGMALGADLSQLQARIAIACSDGDVLAAVSQDGSPTCTAISAYSVNGTLTSGYVPRAIGSATLDDGSIQDDGTTVGVGQAPSSAKLAVAGDVSVSGSISASVAVGTRVTSTIPITFTTSNVWYLMTFNSEAFDTANIHSTASNTSRLIAPVDGVYLIIGGVSVVPNSTGSRGLLFMVNGAGTCTNPIAQSSNIPPSSGNTNSQISTIYYLSANDYVEFCGIQSSGGSLSTVADKRTFFSMVRLP
jgi:hypothetical protein